MAFERSDRTALATAAMGAVAVAAPLVFGATLASPTARASDDAAVVRVIGLGATGLFHGLDALWAAPLLAVPIGSAELRAALASTLAAGVLAALAFLLARRALAVVAPRTPVLAAALCAVAAALATLHFPARVEAIAVGGATLGAALALAPLALVVLGASPPAVAVVLGLAATYDVPVLLVAAASCGVALALAGNVRPRAGVAAAPWALVGLAAPAWELWRMRAAPGVSLDGVSLLAGWLGEGAGGGSAVALLRNELGSIALVLAAVGAFVVLRGRTSRPLGAGLLAAAVSGVAMSSAGAPAGPERFGGALLAAFAAVAVLAACGMAAVVDAVSRAKVPFARASAAMVVLLEMALPVRVADDASLACRKLPLASVETWDALAWGPLPFGAVLLLPSSRPVSRARASIASGALRGDVAVVSTRQASDRATARELSREPRLAPLLRDLALYGAPEEYSLSQLAAARPVLLAFDARWDKRFARHMVPAGLFDRYFVEPRGANDRARSLAPIDERDVQAIVADRSLSRCTADLLRARSLAAAAAGEREYTSSAVAQLYRIEPRDAVGVELLARIAAAHGGVDVRDLAERSTP